MYSTLQRVGLMTRLQEEEQLASMATGKEGPPPTSVTQQEHTKETRTEARID